MSTIKNYKKIEIVHHQKFLSVLEELENQGLIDGYTTLSVHSGYGPLKGEFLGDHLTEEQFYTFIIYPGEPSKLVDEIKKRQSIDTLLIFSSDIVSHAITSKDLGKN